MIVLQTALLCLALLVGQMVRVPLGGGSLQIVDVVNVLQLLLIGLSAFVAALLGPVHVLLVRTLLWFFFWVLVSVYFGAYYLVAGDLALGQALNGVVAAARFAFPGVLLAYLVTRVDFRAWSGRCLAWLLGCAFVVMLFGIFQALFIENFAIRYGPDYVWDVQGHRLVSIFLDPNLAASFTSVVFLVSLVLLQNGVVAWRSIAPVMVVALLATVLTLSRGGMAGLFAGLVVFAFLHRRSLRLLSPRMLLALALGGAASAGMVLVAFDAQFLVESDRFGFTNLSALNRLANYLSLLEVFAENPVLGAGFNFVRALYDDRFYGVSGNYVDGGVLLLLASVGLGGLLVIAASVWLLLRSAAVPARLYLPVAAVLVVQSLATSTLFYPLIMSFVAALLAFASGYAQERERVA